jgi:hypothetical protein
MKTIKELYDDILHENLHSGWVNPKLVLIENKEFSNDYFMIEMDDFEIITDCSYVHFYNLKKRDKILLHCVRVK